MQDPLGTLNLTVPHELHTLTVDSTSVQALKQHLHNSLRRRVLKIPIPPRSLSVNNTRLAILFSGGLDCTVLARMSHDLLPPNEHIDLLNVAFENPRVVQAAKSKAIANSNQGKTKGVSFYESCPDRITGRKALQELRQVCPGRVWRFVEVSWSCSTMASPRTYILLR
jgi:asparagine synthetase B (glutamine-hydrolysing)